jgi:hypothetical protein
MITVHDQIKCRFANERTTNERHLIHVALYCRRTDTRAHREHDLSMTFDMQNPICIHNYNKPFSVMFNLAPYNQYVVRRFVNKYVL